MEIYPQPRDLSFEKASRRVRELKKYYGNLASYCVIIPFLLIINLLSSPDHLWFYWPALGWGIGILLHTFKTFGFSESWEEKKIQEIMKQNSK